MTPEERAKRVLGAMAGHWSDYNYDEIVTQFRDAIKTAIEEEREACARLADDYVIKSGIARAGAETGAAPLSRHLAMAFLCGTSHAPRVADSRCYRRALRI